MKWLSGCALCLALLQNDGAAVRAIAAEFTPLVRSGAPRVIAATEAYPGGRYAAGNLVDGIERTEYSSAGKGTETFLDLDFGAPTRIAAVGHLDRADPATVAASRLTFSDRADFSRTLATVELKHANVRSGTTHVAFEPVTARYARWQVTGLGPQGHGTVGGAEIWFYAPAKPEPSPTRIKVSSQAIPALVRKDDLLYQPVRLTVEYDYAEPAEGTVEISALEPVPVRLRLGRQTIEVPPFPAVETDTQRELTIKVAGEPVLREKLLLRPVRHWTLYFLPHSHVDIGYTHVQSEVEQMQWRYLEQAVELAGRTADYPPEAQFKWNSEVMWAVDGYLRQASPEKREALLGAVRKGQVEFDALYGNELTGLCRPEELFRLIDCARRVSKRYGLTVDAAMISDVPGYTWGIVPSLAHSGVKYLSIGPNHIHRIGRTLEAWGDRPFYWVSPSGKHQVLCWMAGHAYSWFHPGLLGTIKGVDEGRFFEYLQQLEAADYPYDMVQLRYSIGGDNGPPDPDLPELVKQWNQKYAWPRMAISTAGQLMRRFERRYADQVPRVRGDFTPYWEDGAGSSARETSLTRQASERLVQAEALWALLDPRGYPDDRFYAAWRNVILYNEHTWGAHCSISQPDSQFTLDQWKIKQAFARDAHAQSRRLLRAALGDRPRNGGGKVAAVDVYNTASWPRTDLVVLPADLSVAGEAVQDSAGKRVLSQRLASGELAFLAADVPALGARRFFLAGVSDTPAQPVEDMAKVDGTSLRNGVLRMKIDKQSGAIASLVSESSNAELVDRSGGMGLNDYFYVAGRSPDRPQRNGPATVTVADRGPLVASLVVESDAAGCRKLTRRIRLIAHLDRVEIVNLVDKAKVRTPEGVHFGFAFAVPEGVMRVDTPWAVVRPEADQLPGACKNYFSVGRWVDLSNDRLGVTWATVDAPLVEVGAIRVDVPSPFGTAGWIEHLEPSGTLFSYVMNNYWETNYKADQEGPTVFRYAVRPHAGYDGAAAARFGIERSQPLVAVPARGDSPVTGSLVQVEGGPVLITSLKPARGGGAWILRIFNPTDAPARASLRWRDPIPSRVSISSPGEEQGPPVDGPVELAPYEIVTLRAAEPQ